MFTIFRNRGREECGTVVTAAEIAAMERDVAAVNFKRQTGGNYTFGVYFNVIAANMTINGGWIPYVHLHFLHALFLKMKS